MKKQNPAPRIHSSAFVVPNASIVGNVSIGPSSSVWYAAVLRGDIAPVQVGEETNIQDGCVLHVGTEYPCIVGNRVTIGHGAIVHGATVEDEVLIGIGAIVLNGAVIGTGSLIGSGAVVTEGTKIPPGSLVLGIPGRVVGPVSPGQRENIRKAAADYVRLSAENKKPGQEKTR
ncbi:MAG TPA: gamma carbonic anhydrase family protein [Nitrospiria bacterium]|nr:gamma carbonic anhydrase family protein [Nitrospiria bacterium]